MGDEEKPYREPGNAGIPLNMPILVRENLFRLNPFYLTLRLKNKLFDKLRCIAESVVR